MADVIFYDEGAWDIYDFRGIITRSEYASILNRVQQRVESISKMAPNAIKIFLSYPNCATSNWKKNVIVLQQLIQQYFHDESPLRWFYFHMATPNDIKYCEGLHVRDYWTRVESMLIMNAMCR